MQYGACIVGKLTVEYAVLPLIEKLNYWPGLISGAPEAVIKL
jgi:hypothetical protein